jgi:hypothetical protein
MAPTNQDYEAALRLSRKHIYGGNEPYAPAVSSFARMLAEHRLEVLKNGGGDKEMDDRLFYAIENLKEVAKSLECCKAAQPGEPEMVQRALRKTQQALALLEEVGSIMGGLR